MGGRQSHDIDTDQRRSRRLQHDSLAAARWRQGGGWPPTGCAGLSLGPPRALRHSYSPYFAHSAAADRRSARAQSRCPSPRDRLSREQHCRRHRLAHRTRMTENEAFELPQAPPPSIELVVDLEGYEGPIDMLLTL